jgi:hypothetical protein
MPGSGTGATAGADLALPPHAATATRAAIATDEESRVVIIGWYPDEVEMLPLRRDF